MLNEKKLDVYFVDQEKAIDRLQRKVLHLRMREKGIPKVFMSFF